MSKLFRNVPLITYERIPLFWLLFVVLFPRLGLRDAGRPERSGRPTGVPQPQPLRLSARLHSAPIISPHAHPKPPPQMIRHGGLTAVGVFTRFAWACWRIAPSGSARHFSCFLDTPTAPGHSQRPHYHLRRTRLSASCADPVDTASHHTSRSSRLAPPALPPSSILR